MNIKKFRAGNYVTELRVNSEKRRIEDVVIMLHHIPFNFAEKLENGSLKPIKLNINWLDDFGFIQKSEFDYTKGRFVVHIDGFNVCRFYVFLLESTKVYLCTPEYVHELQNVYLDLHDEDLIRKEETHE
jgi:hypothetical protein